MDIIIKVIWWPNRKVGRPWIVEHDTGPEHGYFPIKGYNKDWKSIAECLENAARIAKERNLKFESEL